MTNTAKQPKSAAARDQAELSVSSRGRLARILGISERTLTTRLTEGLREACYDPDAKQYRLPDAITWMRETVWTPKKSEAKERLNRAKIDAAIRKANADAEAAELRTAERAERVVDRDATVNFMRRAFATVRGRFESLPAECAMLFPSDIRAASVAELQSRVRSILRSLASIDPAEVDFAESSE